MKPRILVIENSVAVTGALESILRSSVYLCHRFEFVFLLPQKSQAVNLVKIKGFPVHELPMKELRKSVNAFLVYWPVLLLNTIRLKKIIREEKIDLILCNDFYNLLPVANKMLLGTTNYICYIRFLPSKFPRWLVMFWFRLHNRFAGKLIVVSEAVKRGLPASEKVIVVYNELPGDNTPYAPSHSTVILYPGNYIPGKGQEYALEAFAKIHTRYPEWILRFVGGDMGLEKNALYRKHLQNLSIEYGIENKIEWCDFNSHLKSDYLEAAIVLNFSESESFSLTCLEGMYFGRPVIATRCGGPQEIIEDFKTGLLVPVKNVERMTNALSVLLSDKALRMRLGSSAYVAVREKFGHKNTSERLQSVYLEYISKTAR